MLAKLGLEHNLCLVHFDCPPENVRTILDEHCDGMFFDRTCADLDVFS